MGSVGGCHSKVTEEAVTFAKVTFCGGSNGSESQGAHKGHTDKFSGSEKTFMEIHGKDYFVCEDDEVICQNLYYNHPAPALVVVKLM